MSDQRPQEQNPHTPPQLSPQLSPLKQAFLAIDDLQARLDRAENARHAPIAIVGMACRLPGGATAPEAYWELLINGVDAIEEIPADRWKIDEWYDADEKTPGKMATRHGGFLKEVDKFDPLFFGISPREAVSMDPQQRLLLETTWEALERANLPPSHLRGTQTGVYVALNTSDYALLQEQDLGYDGLDSYHATGMAHSVASGRISYTLGLEGPSITVDTACSSSLVATHLAVQALRSGDCTTAIVGGVNAILSPHNSVTLSKYSMMSPDGRCKFGDARADGFVRAEGCAVVLLKPLERALADGDQVLAVITGSALNQDGASSGLTAPNGPSQQAVIRAALADAGIAPEAVSYVEAHGTGTALGDPIELQGLGAIFGSCRTAGDPLLVGSAKSNIGHTEAVAGLAGLIKVVLMHQHGEIPPSLHFAAPNPRVDWESLGVQVVTERRPWQTEGKHIKGGQPRTGSVSSFGFSGTNAHVVIQSAPSVENQPVQVGQSSAPSLLPLLLSAKQEDALKRLAADYAGALQQQPEHFPAFAATAAQGRDHHAVRAALLASSADEAIAGLNALAMGEGADNVIRAQGKWIDPPRVAFLFTGQGSQYPGMAQGLYTEYAPFREALDACDAILREPLGISLLSLLFAEPGSESDSKTAALLNNTRYTQPALAAVEYALARLWISFGVTPTALLGHSIGEYVAAQIAGVFTLEEMLHLVALRGALMAKLPAGGAMCALFAPLAQVEAALADAGGILSIAAINGPEHVVIAGEAVAVEAVAAGFRERGVRVQPLTVSHAFHSALLEPMLDEFEAAAARIPMRTPRLRVISNRTGKVAGAEIATAAYWRQHAREAVQFARGIETLRTLGYNCFVETGPHPVLLGMAQAFVPADAQTLWLPALRRDKEDARILLRALGAYYAQGGTIDWKAFFAPQALPLAQLPTYPFQRERYWYTSLLQGKRTRKSHSATEGALLGTRLASPLAQTQFAAVIEVESLPFLRDHNVLGESILPATGFIEVALEAAQQMGAPLALSQMEIQQPLVCAEGETRRLSTIVSAGDVPSIEIYSAPQEEDAWVHHATVSLVQQNAPASGPLEIAAIQQRSMRVVEQEEHLALLAAHGLHFGDALQSLRRIWAGEGEGEALGEIHASESVASDPARYIVHPALLDAALQVIATALPQSNATYLPISIERIQVFDSLPAHCFAHVRLHPAGNAQESAPNIPVPELIGADVVVASPEGTSLVLLQGVRLKRARAAASGLPTDLREWLYEVIWHAAPLRNTAPALPADATVSLDGALPHYVGLLPQLDAISIAYIHNALCALGLPTDAGENTTVSKLAASAAANDQHQQIVRRFLDILAEAGIVHLEGDRITTLRALSAVSELPDQAALTAAYPFAAGEIGMIYRCGAALADVLRAVEDPLQLLFPGGSSTDAERMYRESPVARAYTSLLAEAVRNAAATRTAETPYRILEVGGGTGGATTPLLERLAATPTEYTFTDIGPLFVKRAQENFAAYDFVHYETLDLEKNALSQGFAAGAYDCIIAANVVHATRDLRQTLANLRQLLTDEGALVLLEMTRPMPWIDITFGLTTGWWHFVDREVRGDYPLLTADGWCALLNDAGFSAEALPLPAAMRDEHLAHQNILVARRKEDGSGRRSVVVMGSDLVEAASLASALEESGAHLRVVDAIAFQEAETNDRARILFGAETPAGEGAQEVIYLAPPIDTPQDAPSVPYGLGDALEIAQTVIGEQEGARLWFVTNGAQAAQDAARDPFSAEVWGFRRALRVEFPSLRTRCIDLDPEGDMAASVTAIANEVMRGDGEEEIAFRKGERLISRLQRVSAERVAIQVDAASTDTEVHTGSAQNSSSSSASLSASASLRQEESIVVREAILTRRGSFEDLEIRACARRTPAADEVEVRMIATALNFRDVLNVLDMYPGNPGNPGSEGVGEIVRVGANAGKYIVGDKVLVLAPGIFRNYATVPASKVYRMPARLHPLDAVTIPIAYITAYFSLFHLGNLKAGERVLIHAAAGGVGLAAVHLALEAGAEVYATAGSPKKRDYLHSLGVRHIYDSRTTLFAEQILADTDGAGVDIVLNSLAGDFVFKSLEILAEGGRFLELGKRTIVDADSPLLQGREYHLIDWGETAETEPELIRSITEELLDRADRGEVKPLPWRSFPFDQLESAFRSMAQAQQIGKILVVQENGADESPMIRADGSYLVTGGLGGLGLATAQWLAKQGARTLVLMGRSLPTVEAQAAIDALRDEGTHVEVVQGDVSRYDDVLRAVHVAQEIAPLAGIVHSAGALDDGALLQLNAERMNRVFGAKVNGAWHLHRATRDLALDFFLIYGSVASVLGARGQANHAAANAFLDAFAGWRRAHGLPATTIAWGAWSEIGAAVRTAVDRRVQAQGIGTIAPEEGLSLLPAAIRTQSPAFAVLPVNWQAYADLHTGNVPLLLSGLIADTLRSTRRKKTASPRSSQNRTASASPSAAPSRVAELQALAPARRDAAMRDFVRDTAGKVLGLSPQRIDDGAPLNSLGLDSLMAVELRNQLSTGMGAARRLPATLVYDYPTVRDISAFLLAEYLPQEPMQERVQDASAGGNDLDGLLASLPEVQPGSASTLDSMLDNLEGMSNDDVERLLQQMLDNGSS